MMAFYWDVQVLECHIKLYSRFSFFGRSFLHRNILSQEVKTSLLVYAYKIYSGRSQAISNSQA